MDPVCGLQQAVSSCRGSEGVGVQLDACEGVGNRCCLDESLSVADFPDIVEEELDTAAAADIIRPSSQLSDDNTACVELFRVRADGPLRACLLYTSDAADE